MFVIPGPTGNLVNDASLLIEQRPLIVVSYWPNEQLGLPVELGKTKTNSLKAFTFSGLVSPVVCQLVQLVVVVPAHPDEARV